MSPLRELRERHGGSTSAQAINRAIRAEIPGGAKVLEALELWHHICRRRGWPAHGQPEPEHVRAYRDLLGIAQAMEDDVRARWGMPPRPPSNGDLVR